MTLEPGHAASALSAAVLALDCAAVAATQAFALLAAIGIGMLRGAAGARATPGEPDLRTVLVLGSATGVDARAVGLGRSLTGEGLLASALWVGAAAMILPAAALLLASRLGSSLGSWAERAGGLCLIGIGTKILAEHLRAGI